MRHVLEASALTACAPVAVVMGFRAPLVGIAKRVSVHWFKRVQNVLKTQNVLGAAVLMDYARATVMPRHRAATDGFAMRQRQSASSVAWEKSAVTKQSAKTVGVSKAAVLANVANSRRVQRDMRALATDFALRYLRNPEAASWARRRRRGFRTLFCLAVSSGCFSCGGGRVLAETRARRFLVFSDSL